jgi:hypothetical protein
MYLTAPLDAQARSKVQTGVFCPIPQKGIFQELAREILCHWSLCQDLNDRWQVDDLWPLGALVASTEITGL